MSKFDNVYGGDKRDRTADLRSASASLSQTELYPHKENIKF